jgi:hypothetical protein
MTKINKLSGMHDPTPFIDQFRQTSDSIFGKSSAFSRTS